MLCHKCHKEIEDVWALGLVQCPITGVVRDDGSLCPLL
jgi:hypothetical protein